VFTSLFKPEFFDKITIKEYIEFKKIFEIFIASFENSNYN